MERKETYDFSERDKKPLATVFLVTTISFLKFVYLAE